MRATHLVKKNKKKLETLIFRQSLLVRFTSVSNPLSFGDQPVSNCLMRSQGT